jgi:hypothetical protein
MKKVTLTEEQLNYVLSRICITTMIVLSVVYIFKHEAHIDGMVWGIIVSSWLGVYFG